MTELPLDAQHEAHEALSSAVTDFGQRVLSDPRMIRSRMSDLLPDMPRERDLIVTAAEADVAGELTQHVQELRMDPDTAVRLVSRSLSDRKSIDPASSMWVTTEYAQALGYQTRSDAPPPSPSQAGSGEPTVTSYTPYGSPNLQTVPPPRDPTAGPGGYPGYYQPPAPAGGGVYAPPPPPMGGAGYAAPAAAVGGAAYAAPPPPVGSGGYAPPQGPGAGQAPTAVPSQGPPAWVQPTAPAKRRNIVAAASTRTKWTVAVVAVVLLGLVAGLIVWAPWHKVPVAPAAVHLQSPTATSVQVSWAPSQGGATIDHYLILRDGTQVGSVPASQTSYLDNGLAPGTTHRYTIIALSGTQRSQPSAIFTVKTITPSPFGLALGTATWTTVQFHWSAPPNSPTPDGYALFINGSPAITLPGGATSYNDTGLSLATTYQYQVAAVWGSHQSARSSVLSVTTLAAPLQGGAPLQIKTLSTPGGGASLHVGQTWTDSWNVTPTCTANGCTLTMNGEWAPPSFLAVPFTVNLTNSGGWYVGSTTAAITKCESVTVRNTVTLRIAADNGAQSNGAWNSWHGTWVVSSPYTNAGAYYCAAQSWTFSLTGTS